MMRRMRRIVMKERKRNKREKWRNERGGKKRNKG